MSTASSDPMLPAPWRLKRVSRETHDSFTLRLVPEGEGRCPPFVPGQFNMLYAFGVGEVPISISGDPQVTDVMTHTVRTVGAVTRAMRQAKKGDIIGLRGPFGTGWPLDLAEGRDVVLIAGGVGLPPLRPAIYQILAHRGKYGRLSLLYGARSERDLIYRHEIERWRRLSGFSIDVTLDHATRDWSGNVGVVTLLVQRLDLDPSASVAMICGPEIMMRFTIAELKRRGFREDNIFVSMERNMKCAVGFCGHCQFGPEFVCKNGPVFRFDRIAYLFSKREI